MKNAKPTVLITGVAGFVGSNLADRLVREGYDVVGVDDLSAGILQQVPTAVDFHEADIRSRQMFDLSRNIDIIFHLAARNCILDCQKHPYETADVNVMGTLNVFESARAAGVKRIIYAESSAIYEGSKTFPTPETDFTPLSFYAITKASDHLFAKAYQQFMGMNTVGLRYLNVYGPRQDYRRAVPPVMSAFIIKLLTGQTPQIFGDGTKRRDFIHVDDVNEFHLLCIDNPKVVNRTFNLGSGVNYSIQEVYDTIRDIVGAKAEPEKVADALGEAIVNLGDISQARSVGWEPRTSLRAGVAGMVEFIRGEITSGNISGWVPECMSK